MPHLPRTVDAIAIFKNGGLEVIQKTPLPFPDVRPGEVIVKVEYVGINYIDTYYRSGLYPSPRFPAVLGKEAAGTIVGLPTDRTILESAEFKRRNFAIGRRVAVVSMAGCHSTYISVPWIDVYPLPSNVPSRIAAAVGLQGLTALTLLEESYYVQRGDTILIHTIAGGLGLIMCQIAKAMGAIVIGTTSTEAKARIAKAHGADYVILYPVENTVQRVLEITRGVGVQAIFDGVGKDTFEDDLAVIAQQGTLVSVGNTSGAVPPVAPIKLAQKNIKLLRPMIYNYLTRPDKGYYYGKKLFDIVAHGMLKVNIFKEYAFSQDGYRQAQKDLVGGRTAGKLVIKVQ